MAFVFVETGKKPVEKKVPIVLVERKVVEKPVAIAARPATKGRTEAGAKKKQASIAGIAEARKTETHPAEAKQAQEKQLKKEGQPASLSSLVVSAKPSIYGLVVKVGSSLADPKPFCEVLLQLGREYRCVDYVDSLDVTVGKEHYNGQLHVRVVNNGRVLYDGDVYVHESRALLGSPLPYSLTHIRIGAGELRGGELVIEVSNGHETVRRIYRVIDSGEIKVSRENGVIRISGLPELSANKCLYRIIIHAYKSMRLVVNPRTGEERVVHYGYTPVNVTSRGGEVSVPYHGGKLMVYLECGDGYPPVVLKSVDV